MIGVQPLEKCRREIRDKKALASRISDLQKNRQNVGKEKNKKTASKKIEKSGIAKGVKKNAQLEGLLKLKSQKGLKKEHLQLLGELEKQLMRQNTTSVDLQKTMEENVKMSGKLRKLQHKEIDSAGGEEDVAEELQNMTSLLLDQIQKREDGEEEEEEWVTEGEGEEEEEEEETDERGKSADKLKIAQERLKKILRESKNLEKIRREKKESLERHRQDQNKKMEASVEKMRQEQKKILQQMASLTSNLVGKKRERDDYSGEDSNDEDDVCGVEETSKNSSKRQKPSQSKKRKVASTSKKAESEMQLMKYLQSLQ